MSTKQKSDKQDEKAAAEKAAAEETKALPHLVERPFQTVGAVTGKNRVCRAGTLVVAPEGEFTHLPSSYVRKATAAEIKAAAPSPETAARR